MKVALLLSGLARKVEEGYNASWKHIVENYDTDVYLHAWKDEEWQKVGQVYPNAKSLQIQEPFKFTKYKEGVRLHTTDKSRPLPQYDVMSCFRQLPMFYSWQMGYRPLYDSMIDYDVVIRSRYDVQTYSPLKLEELNMGLIHISAGNVRFLDDNLCIANKKNSDILFKTIFDNVIAMSRERGVLNSAEDTWSSIVQSHSLNHITVKTDALRFTLLRTNYLWWGDEQGNIVSEVTIV